MPLTVRIGIPLLTLIGLLFGCSTNFGERCSLPRRVERDCRSTLDNSHTNCVMTDNLSCDSRLCAVYQDSEPYCTHDCQEDGDCPDGSRCVPFFLDAATDCFCADKKQADGTGAASCGSAQGE